MTVEAKTITKKFDDTPVLKECSCSFVENGVSALMGPNGSGKSTLLRICALLETPDSGNVIYSEGNTILPNDMKLRRMITLVLPRVGVFNASVWDNVAYGLRVRKIPREMIRAKTEQCLVFVGLDHKKKQGALTLSSGETQKLGIARALAIEPAILFLDEPTAFVDELSKQVIERLILDIGKRTGTTIILTTHDAAQAERLANTILTLRDGAVVPVSSPVRGY